MSKQRFPVHLFARIHPWINLLDGRANAAWHARCERAQAIFERDGIQTTFAFDQAGHQLYTVEGSQPGCEYSLTIQSGCTCPDSSPYGGRAPFGWCKHRLAAWAFRARGFHRVAA